MRIEEIKKEIKNIKLTPEEKRAIFTRVMNTPKISPYAPVRSYFRFFRVSFTYVTLSLIALVATGSGLSYAALDTLPGDKLYPVKIKFTEPALDMLAFSPSSRAEREAMKAIRRLNEAQRLAQVNKLTVEKRIEIEKSFSKSVLKFNTSMKKAEDDSKSKIEVNEKVEVKNEGLKNNFESSLEVQADLLSKTGEEKEAENTEQEEEITILENTVREQMSSIKGSTEPVPENKEEQELKIDLNIDLNTKVEYNE